MHSSSNSAVSTMWPEGKMKVTEVTKRPQTAGTIFKNSMIALTQNLASKVRKANFYGLRFFIVVHYVPIRNKSGLFSSFSYQEPYYIRCIKPNEIKSSSISDSTRIKHQVGFVANMTRDNNAPLMRC